MGYDADDPRQKNGPVERSPPARIGINSKRSRERSLVEDFWHHRRAQAVGLREVRTEQRAAVVEEVLGDAIGIGVDEIVGHVAGFAGDLFDRHEFVIDAVVEDWAADRDRAVDIVPHGVLDCLFADLAGLVGVAIGTASDEATLKVSVGVGANALELEAVLDRLREQVAEGAGAGELEVAVGIALFTHQFGDHRIAVLVGNSFRNSDRAHSKLRVHTVDISEEFLGIEGALRHIDEVRTIVVVLATEGGSSGEEAGVTAHHDTDVDALERAVVEVDAGECLSDETGCGAEARAVVVFHQVVVDRLGNVDRAQFVVCLLRLFVDDTDGVGRVVATDIEEVADVVGLHDLEHAGAVFLIGLVAGREES